jgi:hypothetical protein
MPPATPPFDAGPAGYEAWAGREVAHWRSQMLQPPSLVGRAGRELQQSVNRVIPERVHAAVTDVVRRLTEAILAGSNFVNGAPVEGLTLAERDRRALGAISDYRNVAAIEGGATGWGGFWLSMADFPALITIKIRLLFDLARIYGHDAEAFAERLYILDLFQIAFSGAAHRATVFRQLEDWDRRPHPEDFAHFDWRTFQQEYRDAIDLPKLAQMIPLIGAPVGAVVNWRLTERVGRTAMNGYRMRWLAGSGG